MDQEKEKEKKGESRAAEQWRERFAGDDRLTRLGACSLSLDLIACLSLQALAVSGSASPLQLASDFWASPKGPTMGWDGWHAAQHGASRPANKGSLGFLGSKSPACHRATGKDKGASSGMTECRVTAPVSQVVTAASTTALAMPSHSHPAPSPTTRPMGRASGELEPVQVDYLGRAAGK